MTDKHKLAEEYANDRWGLEERFDDARHRDRVAYLAGFDKCKELYGEATRLLQETVQHDIDTIEALYQIQAKLDAETIRELRDALEDSECKCSPEIEIDPEERQCSRCQALHIEHPNETLCRLNQKETT